MTCGDYRPGVAARRAAEDLARDERRAQRVAVAVASKTVRLLASVLHEHEVALGLHYRGDRVPGAATVVPPPTKMTRPRSTAGGRSAARSRPPASWARNNGRARRERRDVPFRLAAGPIRAIAQDASSSRSINAWSISRSISISSSGKSECVELVRRAARCRHAPPKGRCSPSCSRHRRSRESSRAAPRLEAIPYSHTARDSNLRLFTIRLAKTLSSFLAVRGSVKTPGEILALTLHSRRYSPASLSRSGTALVPGTTVTGRPVVDVVQDLWIE